MVNLISVFIDMSINKPLEGYTIRLISRLVYHHTCNNLIILVGLVFVQ
jgi:hypothetical protein